MTSTALRLLPSLARAGAALLASLALASCGGGGVSAGPSPIVDSPTVSILPATAVMYSGLPTTFVLSGGTGAYVIASSNQAVLQVAGGVTGRSLTLVPNPVTAETTVTLTVRDTGDAPPVSATVTVKPGTVNNDITITPSATQDPSCSPAICTGGDAEVKVTISQGGIPLAARGVRFEAISGSFTFVAQASGVIEGAGLAFVTTTDETGVARAKIRVSALAPNQTAVLRVTDLGAGAYRQASFPIAQFTGNTPAFFTLPSSITFTGPFVDVCAANANARIAIYGGTPPYAISGGTSGFSVSQATVNASGGSFTVTLAPVPSCFENAPIGVTDSTGRTIVVTLSSVAGTATAPVVVADLQVVPDPITVSCGTMVTAVIFGGTDPFAVFSNHPRIVATLAAADSRTVTITRTAPDAIGDVYLDFATLTVTDGVRSQTARVDIVGADGTTPAANCP